jgi:hypothetical protein
MALADYAKERIAATGLELPFTARTTFKEFAVRVGRNARDVVKDALDQGIHPGYALGRDYPGWTTSCSSPSPKGARRTRSTASRRSSRREADLREVAPGPPRRRPPATDVPVPEIPAELRRSEPPRLPEIAEPDLLRHFTELSTRNFGIDTGFYPLGSCTMKHNPRVNERLAALPGFRDLHPLEDETRAQGALRVCVELQDALAEVTGLEAVSLQPAAGSQGELTGLLLMHAYFADRGEDEQRRKIVVPDTAHGTNPASVTMAGYELVDVQTDARGNIDVDDLRTKVDDTTAGLMLTNPSTLGLFDENIEEISAIFHDAGSLMYYDGANLNAVLRDLAARRHGLRDRPHQPAQDVLAAARRRRGRAAARSRLQAARAVPAGPGDRPRRRCVPARRTTAEIDRQGARASSGRSASSSRRTRSCVPTGRGCARCPRSRCSTRTTCSRGCATPTSCRSTACACTSSSSRRAG